MFVETRKYEVFAHVLCLRNKKPNTIGVLYMGLFLERPSSYMFHVDLESLSKKEEARLQLQS